MQLYFYFILFFVGVAVALVLRIHDNVAKNGREREREIDAHRARKRKSQRIHLTEYNVQRLHSDMTIKIYRTYIRILYVIKLQEYVYTHTE